MIKTLFEGNEGLSDFRHHLHTLSTAFARTKESHNLEQDISIYVYNMFSVAKGQLHLEFTALPSSWGPESLLILELATALEPAAIVDAQQHSIM